jgi:hypothetical protein
VDFNFEAGRVKVATISLNPNDLPQNLVGTDRIVKNRGGVTAKRKLERFT